MSSVRGVLRGDIRRRLCRFAAVYDPSVDTRAGAGNPTAYDERTDAVVARASDSLAGALELQDTNAIYAFAGVADGLNHAVRYLRFNPSAEETALDSQYLYWADPSAQRLYNAALGGGPITVVTVVSGAGGAVAVDGAAIDWTTSTAIKKLAKCKGGKRESPGTPIPAAAYLPTPAHGSAHTRDPGLVVILHNEGMDPSRSRPLLAR